MRRRPVNKFKDRKVFKRSSAPHPSNTVRFVMRGGIRK